MPKFFNAKVELPRAALFLFAMAVAGWMMGGLHG
jgi:hypothetical protein